MTVQPVARRYAAALFDVMQSGGGQASSQADAISQALTDLAGLTHSHSELSKLIRLADRAANRQEGGHAGHR
jgi:F0F1-type ATP synthase delta subunit